MKKALTIAWPWALLFAWLYGLNELVHSRLFARFPLILGAFLLSSVVMHLLVVGFGDGTSDIDDER